MFQAIRFEKGTLHLLDQTKLPHQEIWLTCDDIEKTARAIETMVVRGAPAIACAAALGLAAHWNQQNIQTKNWGSLKSDVQKHLKRLAATRPTAVNLFHAIHEFEEIFAKLNDSADSKIFLDVLNSTAMKIFESDLRTCQQIGDQGLRYAKSKGLKKVNVLTHCNTGSLATAGYGTALGVIRSLHREGMLGNVFVDETRPFLQGSRLTAFELQKDGIKFDLIADNAASHFMKLGEIDWVVVGADRIAKNGDTANKIGTYQVAVSAKYHGVSMFIAAPKTTLDLKTPNGEAIHIEDRPKEEVTEVFGVKIAPNGVSVRNPSFDVTPRSLIEAIFFEDEVWT